MGSINIKENYILNRLRFWKREKTPSPVMGKGNKCWLGGKDSVVVSSGSFQARNHAMRGSAESLIQLGNLIQHRNIIYHLLNQWHNKPMSLGDNLVFLTLHHLLWMNYLERTGQVLWLFGALTLLPLDPCRTPSIPVLFCKIGITRASKEWCGRQSSEIKYFKGKFNFMLKWSFCVYDYVPK